jgi:uncharacterized protein (DUF1800 family)
MKRAGLLFAVFSIAVLTFQTTAAGRFDVKLSPEKRIVHVLNRLTFGPRPGDIEEVRRMGVEKWIDLQLHPERIPERPELEAKLKPLETLQLATWQIMEKYSQPVFAVPARPVNLTSLVSQQQLNRLMNGGSIEERKAILDSVPADKRQELLTAIPVQALEGLPNLQRESNALKQQATQARAMEMRRMNPPLQELLTQDQLRVIRMGPTREKLAFLDSLDDSKRKQVIRALGPQITNTVPELRRELMAITQPLQLPNSELIENKIYRAIYSNHPLEEVLVDFWLNHFNVYNGKMQVRVLLTSYERDAIRPHVLGRFKDMLLATARHPAMLMYLDNFLSQVPRDDFTTPIHTNGAPFRRPGLNENYGREVMELHTLGVDGGYTQDDVLAVARAFTGWSIYDPQKYGEFQFNPAMHDRKEKLILGRTLPPGRGEEDGLDVIDILAHHPSTAKFISRKLAQRFVADDPPQSLIDRMADTFTKTEGDIRAVLQTMFSSVEFSSEGAFQSKLKSPLEVVVSAVRALNAEVTDAYPLAQRIAELGQPLYGKVEPTGYPNTGEGWASTAGILGRINFATALTSGQIYGVKADMTRFDLRSPADVAEELLSAKPSTATLDAIRKSIEGREAPASMLTTIVLGSPEFQRR